MTQSINDESMPLKKGEINSLFFHIRENKIILLFFALIFPILTFAFLDEKNERYEVSTEVKLQESISHLPFLRETYILSKTFENDKILNSYVKDLLDIKSISSGFIAQLSNEENIKLFSDNYSDIFDVGKLSFSLNKIKTKYDTLNKSYEIKFITSDDVESEEILTRYLDFTLKQYNDDYQKKFNSILDTKRGFLEYDLERLRKKLSIEVESEIHLLESALKVANETYRVSSSEMQEDVAKTLIKVPLNRQKAEVEYKFLSNLKNTDLLSSEVSEMKFRLLEINGLKAPSLYSLGFLDDMKKIEVKSLSLTSFTSTFFRLIVSLIFGVFFGVSFLLIKSSFKDKS